MRPILYETHTHTPLCKHARGLPEEYARIAKERRFAGIIVTCHSPMPDGFSSGVRMSTCQFPDYLRMVESAREVAHDVDIRLGMESDYFPGMEAWLSELHQKADFHYILGSVHPQIREFKELCFNGDWFEYHRTYFYYLAAAAETLLFDCLAHPDIVKNMGCEYWDLERLMPDIRHALDRIAETGVAMELNTSGLNKTMPEMNPGMEILREIQGRGIPVVVGADAHVPERVGDRYLDAFDKLEEAGFESVSFFLERRRRDVPLKIARQSLAPGSFSASKKITALLGLSQ